MRFDFAIIGCGASGAVMAANLFRRARRALAVCCIEPAPRLGAGLAYGRCGPEHLLNVPASRISAMAGEELDFVHWLDRRGLLADAPGRFFAPRRVYADYLTDCLGRALRGSSHRHVVDHRPDLALALQRRADGDWQVELAGGETIEAGQVVLALGNLPSPAPPAGLESLAGDTRYLHDPWQLVGRKLRRDRAVAIVGSGLTGVDVLHTLIERGHRGMIDVFSRSGRWPTVHLEVRSGYSFRPDNGNLRQLFKEVRSHIEAAGAAGIDWRDVIDGLRPHTQKLWQQLAERDKRRFRRLLRGPWGRARHRMPPAVGARLEQWYRQGRFRIHSARRLEAEPTATEILLRAEPGAVPVRVRRVINATGPLVDLRRSDNPLVRDLLGSGRARPGPAGIGLDTDADGRVLDRDGGIPPGLFALGPLRQGTLLESTAIPEIRIQAFRLAELCLSGAAGTGVKSSPDLDHSSDSFDSPPATGI